MTAIFVTGTGTDIGKTYVTAGLIRHLRRTGHTVGAIKPVATGFGAGTAADSDAAILLAELGWPVTMEHIERISPFRFAAPLSPEMAAQRENRTLDFDAVVEFCRRAIIAHTGILLIEGVGGIMVPLNRDRTVLDWMAALGRPAILVAGSYLGSLSHTLTCLEVLRHRDVPLKAVVVDETAGSTVALDDTAKTVARFAAPTPVVTVPRAAGADAFARIAALL
jgi:dethiobiotin synthetase